MRAAASNFVLLHFDLAKDREAFQAWSKKYKDPGPAIPKLYVIKPTGEMAVSQLGAPSGPRLVDFLAKHGKELAVAVAKGLSPKVMGLVRAAEKEAAALLKDGKFVSAYERLSKVGEELQGDHKSLSRAKETMKAIVAAALERVSSARDAAVGSGSEAERLDGAYHLHAIAAGMKGCAEVFPKAEEALKALAEDAAAKKLSGQAELLFQARDAVRKKDAAKAKELYGRISKDHAGTEAARRAGEKLAELDG